MYILIFLFTVISVYVYTFKEEFNSDNVNKVATVILVTTFIIFTVGIVSGILRG